MAIQVTMPKPTVLAVDDTPDNLTLISTLLKDLYTVKVATDGETALKIAGGETMPDIVVLDIMMRGMDGYEVCRRLKADAATRNIPVIFLSALTDPHHEAKGLGLGAVDYVTKPISPPILMARIKNHLAFKASADFLRDQADFLAQEVARRTQEISAIQEATVLAIAALAETRDERTVNHIRRTQHYVKALAEQLRTHPRFGWFLSDEAVVGLYRTAPLHDIGNVGVPNAILAKRGALTPDEYAVVKTHTALGGAAIDHAERALGTKVSMLQLARDFAFGHQEKWDGTGYPEGRKGEEIPVAARLMAVADAYDAMTSPRAYREPVSHDAALAALSEERSKHFDPDVVDAFVAIQDQVRTIAAEFADGR